MRKPEGVSQKAWDAAEIIAKEATRDAMRDPLMPYYITVTPHIARAIMAAKAEDREACAAEFDKLAEFMDGDGVPTKDERGGTWHSDDPMYVARYCRERAAAIRSRKEVSP